MAFPSDPADLFVRLVVELDVELFDRAEVFEWMHSDRVRDIADLLEGAALDERGISSESIEGLLEVAIDEEYAERVFAILLGLDRALLYANPFFGSFEQGALTRVAARYARTGTLNSDMTSGALLPRCAFPARKQATPNSFNDAFISAVWVPRSEWNRTNRFRIPTRNDLTRVEREAGFEVACVPFVDDADDFEWSTTARHGKHFFRISLPKVTPLADRIRRVLADLDLSGVEIAVLPELTLSRELLDEWQTVLREVAPPAESKLKWLFAGSGDISTPGRPTNRCVLLDRVTGEVVLTQGKIYPFTLTQAQLAEWRLSDRLGEEDAEEDIETERRVVVSESRLGRIALLVCEDLARLVDIAPALRTHGISHVVSPVFSKETKPYHWEHMKAKEYATEVGALVVVSNSLVVGRLMSQTGPWGTALVHSPVLTQLGISQNWHDMAIFRVVAGDPVARPLDPPVSREDDD